MHRTDPPKVRTLSLVTDWTDRRRSYSEAKALARSTGSGGRPLRVTGASTSVASEPPELRYGHCGSYLQGCRGSARVGATAPGSWSTRQAAGQGDPLNGEQGEDADGVKRLVAASGSRKRRAWSSRAAIGIRAGRTCQRRRPAVLARERRCEDQPGQDMTAEEDHRPDRQRDGLRHAFRGVLQKARPHARRVVVHAAARQSGAVDEIRAKTRGAKGARQHQAVVAARADGGVAAGLRIGRGAHRDQLAAGGGERAVGAAAASAARGDSRGSAC